MVRLNDEKSLEVVTMKELIKFMAQALVDFPDQVEVSEVTGEQTSVIELRVAKEDLGKVIGKDSSGDYRINKAK